MYWVGLWSWPWRPSMVYDAGRWARTAATMVASHQDIMNSTTNPWRRSDGRGNRGKLLALPTKEGPLRHGRAHDVRKLGGINANTKRTLSPLHQIRFLSSHVHVLVKQWHPTNYFQCKLNPLDPLKSVSAAFLLFRCVRRRMVLRTCPKLQKW